MPAAQMYLATKTLTNAQVLALPTTPIEIIPAPGAGKIISFISGHITFNFNDGAYTNQDAGASMFLRIGVSGSRYFANPVSKEGDLDNFGTYFGQNDHYTPLFVYMYANATTGQIEYTSDWAVGDVTNKPVQILIENNAAGVLTDGHADNTMVVGLHYAIIDV